MVDMTEWQYKGTCDEARILALEVNAPFEDIAGRLEREMEITCCHTCRCCDRKGYKRTIYCVEVTPQLFDIFFNSEFGYRGEYFRSPKIGLSANRMLLDTLSPRLIAWTRVQCPNQDPEFATLSLAAPSAKAWLAEESLSICERCTGEWTPSTRSDLEIVNGRWELDSHTHAVWGCQAHWFRKVRVIGAFLNDTGIEYVAAHKAGRADHIWARGWS